MSWLTKTFEFQFEDTRIIHVPKERVMENILDFDHVNYVHKRCYAYCRMIARHRSVSLLEYGIYHIPGIPWVTHYTLYHVFQPPDTVVHFARSGDRGPWTKGIMRVADLQTPQGTATRYDHSYERILPVWMKPFQSLLKWWIKRWVDILWEEDRSIVERRHRLVQAGFRDSAACAEWVYERGTGNYRFRQGEAVEEVAGP